MEEQRNREEFIDQMIKRRKEENEAFLKLLEAIEQKKSPNLKKSKINRKKNERL
jgi:GTPase SAR1 family protein